MGLVTSDNSRDTIALTATYRVITRTPPVSRRRTGGYGAHPAAAYAHLGDRDAAFALLEDIFRNGREPGLFTLINSPWMQSLKADARWQSIVVAAQR
jgi:hypothetical protein